jgi:hypothetical protein
MIEYLETLAPDTLVFAYDANGKRTAGNDAEGMIDILYDEMANPCPEDFDLVGVAVDNDAVDAVENLRKAFADYRDKYDTRYTSPKNWAIGQNLYNALEKAKGFLNIPTDAFSMIYSSEELWENEDWWIDERENDDIMRWIWSTAHSNDFHGDLAVAKEAFLNAETQAEENKKAICHAIAGCFDN